MSAHSRQSNQATANSSQTTRGQRATHNRKDKQLMLLSSWASACAEPNTVNPMHTVSGPRHRQQVTHRRNDEHLTLLSTSTSTCAEPKQSSPYAHQWDNGALGPVEAMSSSCCPRHGLWPTSSQTLKPQVSHCAQLQSSSLARLPGDAISPSPGNLSLTPSAPLGSIGYQVPFAEKCPQTPIN